MKEVVSLLKNVSHRRFVQVYFVVCAVLYIVALGELATSFYVEKTKAKKEADKLARVLSIQTSDKFSKIDFAILDVVKILNKKNKLSEWSDLEIEKIIDDNAENLREVESFFVIGLDGYTRSKTNMSGTYYLADRDYFYKQLLSTKDELIFSKPLTSRRTGQQIVVITRKIANIKNEFMGVAAVVLPLEKVAEMFAHLNLEKDTSITLNHRDNILYSRFPWVEGFVGKSLANQDTVKHLFNENNNFYFSEKRSSVDGIDRLSSSRKVGNYDFFIVVALSRELYLAGWRTKFLVYFLGLSILSLVALIYLIKFLKSYQELEEQRRLAIQTTKLTALGEMAGGVAHEINNPLTIIAVRCEQLLKHLDNDQFDKDYFKNSIEKMRSTTDRIAKIVKGLKSLSRNSEKDPLIPTTIKEVIDNSVELCKEKFRIHSVKFKVDPIPSALISCRESQIVQVILNLLTNAYDAIEGQSGDKWVQVSTILKDEKVQIMIIDSGEGIPNEVVENMMQPFYTTKAVGKGTGLGLSISKEIIRDHQGVLYFKKDSEHTCFVIDLPVHSTGKDT